MSKYKYTIEDVKILFEKYNYVLLDKEYKGANYKYVRHCYQCNVGKRYNISDLRMMFFFGTVVHLCLLKIINKESLYV